jgi:hypothetical protein
VECHDNGLRRRRHAGECVHRRPDRPRQLAQLLIDATTATMDRLPCYVPANIHRSLGGTKVVNYAQWRRVGEVEAVLADPKA